MKNKLWLTLFIAIYMLFNPVAAQQFKVEHWKALPDSTGFAGSFAGLINDRLIVAGGSNFPGGGAPWLGSKKVWYDPVFLLETKTASWKKIGNLPRPLGYGVSVSLPEGLLCIGGSNAGGHRSEVLLLQLKNGILQTDTLQPLPQPLANTCGVLVRNKIYVAGGITAPDAKTTSSAFYELDLSKGVRAAQWKELPTWPGPSRMLGIAAAVGDFFYLFSGTELINGQRIYLRDAYRFSEQAGWAKIAALPWPVVAAPSPLMCDQQYIYLLGGDDGSNAGRELREAHPGFSTKMLEYNYRNDTWSVLPGIKKDRPLIPVTTTAVLWKDHWVIPGGEIKPGIRTPAVLGILKAK
ncbi:galactose oxidase [Niabella sp. CC-SYL272]|uniref:kelch repeat-containing protein n=1 Tax=Niabella agricola TaxID=2891571 RepID=UPI001F4678A7|nr:kelch repeat-containing protein [Niabella agricola]MCF3109648.1 galactose oxidase [Niabella agricola]